MAKKTGDLQLDRAEAFVARERFLQRVGVGIMCVFVLAGAVGLFGQGALSHREATSGNLTVRYERFSRLLLRNEIAIAARVAAADGTIARIALDKAFLDDVSIEETRPHADMEIHESRIVLMGRLAFLTRRMSRVMESVPVVVVENGKVLERAMQEEGLDVEEVLAAARELHGLESLDEIKYAIVERHGGISIIPADR